MRRPFRNRQAASGAILLGSRTGPSVVSDSRRRASPPQAGRAELRDVLGGPDLTVTLNGSLDSEQNAPPIREYDKAAQENAQLLLEAIAVI